jgi:hypothetical protein
MFRVHDIGAALPPRRNDEKLAKSGKSGTNLV